MQIVKSTSPCKRLYHLNYLNVLYDFRVAFNVALQMLDNASVDAYSNLECDLWKR